MRTRVGTILALLVATMAAIILFAAPASATVTEASGNVQPQSGATAAQCAAGQRWVYVNATGGDGAYNPLAKSTDSLGASAQAPPNSNADQYNDGVTVTVLSGNINASFTVNEATDPSTSVTIVKLVVKSGNHYTIYTGSDASQSTPHSSPAVGATMSISHAYVCYSLGPPAVVSESHLAVLLPIGGALVLGGGGWLILRRRGAMSSDAG